MRYQFVTRKVERLNKRDRVKGQGGDQWVPDPIVVRPPSVKIPLVLSGVFLVPVIFEPAIGAILPIFPILGLGLLCLAIHNKLEQARIKKGKPRPVWIEESSITKLLYFALFALVAVCLGYQLYALAGALSLAFVPVLVRKAFKSRTRRLIEGVIESEPPEPAPNSPSS